MNSAPQLEQVSANVAGTSTGTTSMASAATGGRQKSCCVSCTTSDIVQPTVKYLRSCMANGAPTPVHALNNLKAITYEKSSSRRFVHSRNNYSGRRVKR